jgi:ABC-2 type transport system ATP-binding protein
MIILTNVTKKFGEKNAVDSLSIEIKTGEVIGFLGVNGAGKTTTMRMITGVLKPTSGTVSVDGVDPLEHHIATTQKIGYLPENNPLYPDMKVEEYLQFIREVKKHGNYLEIAEKIGLIELRPSPLRNSLKKSF